jgi:hypothetical protein
MPYTNGTGNVASNLVVAGTNTAAYFVGDGSLLTGVSASTTNAVTSIVVGSSNVTGTTYFTGTRVSSTSATNVTFSNVEYIGSTIVPISSTWEVFWFGPRDEDITLSRIYAQAESYTVTFSVVEAASNATWRVVTTNLQSLVATSTGTYSTNFTDTTIAAGNKLGIYVEDLDSRCNGLVFSIKITY